MNIELLAPAGNIDAAYASFKNGSDAIYLAGPSFGARAYANNFSLEEIKEIIEYAHIIDKKVYITVNTLLFEKEIDEVLKFLDYIYENDCDAVIVQDLGLAEIINKRYPGLDIHASTQMNIHTVDDALKLKELGYKRIVLAREASIDVIKEIKEKVDIELEVFIHGALCVSYSGNCYFSSIVGKRSGNRGRCAQPCRKEYTLVNNNDNSRQKWKYYLSPKDLCTIDRINELKEIGVDSLKIEGRMKRAEYVAQVVKTYRKALLGESILEKDLKDLKLIFNREFTKGFIFNESNNNYSNLKYQNHQGVLIGKVTSTYKDKVTIKLSEDLVIDDAIRLVGKNSDAITINNMYVNNKLVKEASKGSLVTIKVHEKNLDNASVFLTTSIKQIKDLQNDNQKNIKIAINGKCYLEDDYFVLEISDGKNIVKEKSLEKSSLSEKDFSQRFYEQINKTNESNYIFNSLTLDVKSRIISIKEINRLRREALKKLDLLRGKRYKNRYIKEYTFNKLNLEKQPSTITVKVSNEEQLKAAISEDVKIIYVANLELYKKYCETYNLIYASPRINDNTHKQNMLTSSISKVRDNYGSVYMNVTNSYSAYKLFSLGIKSVGLSIELSENDIIDLIENFKKNFSNDLNFEMMVYGYYELMISKYCPIQKELGIECKNCNMCIKNSYSLVDKLGYDFRVIKGEGCYTKILNSKRVHLIKYISKLKEIGISRFLLDFSVEDFNETKEIIKLYNLAFNGIIKEEKLSNVTYGHFNEGVL